jgi:hypothetical protein
VSRQKSTSSLESPTPAVARSHRKPQADLYTILLVVALVAILVAILFLYLFIKTYKTESGGGGPPPVAMIVQPAHAAPTLLSHV